MSRGFMKLSFVLDTAYPIEKQPAALKKAPIFKDLESKLARESFHSGDWHAMWNSRRDKGDHDEKIDVDRKNKKPTLRI